MSTVNTLDRHVVGHLLAAMGVDAWGVAGNVPRLPRAAMCFDELGQGFGPRRGLARRSGK